MHQDQAEILALQVITYITGDENALKHLMAYSGMGVHDIRENLKDPAFLGGILDFMLNNEAILLGFSEHNETPPELILHARRTLPGGEGNLWD